MSQYLDFSLLNHNSISLSLKYSYLIISWGKTYHLYMVNEKSVGNTYELIPTKPQIKLDGLRFTVSETWFVIT